MKLRQFYVYILSNEKNAVLYIGVTNNLERRIYEHKLKLVKGFTEKYNLGKLLYYEICDSAEQAIAREKQLKNWHRNWKLNLIKTTNPKFIDLFTMIERDAETSSA